jgi:hypothetical protein
VVRLVAEALPALPAGGLFPVCVTAGTAVGQEDGVVGIPRAELAGVLQVLLQTRRLAVARDPSPDPRAGDRAACGGREHPVECGGRTGVRAEALSTHQRQALPAARAVRER